MANQEKNDLTEVKQKLNSLLEAVQSKKEESQKSGTSWGWVTAAIAAILAFVGLAFAAYDAWKKGREIAKLKHEMDKQEELKIQAEINAKITAESDVQKSQRMVAEQLAKQIEKTKKEIIALEKERLSVHNKIDKVTSWADIDKLMGK